MSVIDNVSGRLKNAAGNGTEDPQLRRHGAFDMRAREANDDRRESRREVERLAAVVAELKRRRR